MSINKYKICVCGGGNIGHAVSGICSYNGHITNVLTRNPEKWNKLITINTKNSVYKGLLNKISDLPEDVIPDSDIIIISCPIFAIKEIISKIENYLTSNMILINIPGRFFLKYTNHLSNDIITIARTPYICRINEYGKSVNIYGVAHNSLNYWTSNNDRAKKILNNLFDFNINYLENHLSIDLVNSNLLLHSARLFTLFSNNQIYDYCPLFYKDWCINSSELLINCDIELQRLINILNNHYKNKIYIKPILEHYEVNDAKSLTNKIRNIDSLSNIKTPIIFKNNKYYPDYTDRYFKEEVICLKYVLDLAKENNIELYYINSIYCFFNTVCN
jgi:hypothetical protein